jgi:polyferredoxin
VTVSGRLGCTTCDSCVLANDKAVLDSQRSTQASWGLVQSVRACGKGTHLEVRVLRVAVTVSGRLDCTTCGTCVLANDKAVLDSQRATQAAWGLVQSVRACGKGTHLEVRVLRVTVTASGRLGCTTCVTCVLANDQAVLDSQRATQAPWGLVQSVRACGKGTHLDLRVLWDAVTVSGRLGCTTCDSCVLANDKAVLDSQRATQAAWGLVQSVWVRGRKAHTWKCEFYGLQ